MHGACNHWRRDCLPKANGHDDSLTFQDRKGGSNQNLEWLVGPKCYNTNYFTLNKLFNSTNNFTQNPSVAQSNICNIILKTDTGASNHYIRTTDATFQNQIKITINPVQYHLPNNMILASTQKGLLPVNVLTQTAKHAHMLLSLINSSLLSIGQLCDKDCMTLFTKNGTIICKNEKIVLQGKRNFLYG